MRKNIYHKTIFYMILVCALLSVAHNQGYAYQIRVMKIFNTYLRRDQYIIGCCDYHDKTNSANSVQRAYIESLLKRCKRSDWKCIVEDLTSVNNNGRMACCGYMLNTTGLLGGAADAVRSLGVEVDNIEYRFCRVAGIGPLLHNPALQPTESKSSMMLTMNALYNEVINEIKILEKYDDGRKMNGVYKRAIDDAIRFMYHHNFERTKNYSIAHYCSQLQKRQYQQKLQELCMFDSALVDIKLVHSILSAYKKPYILIMTGGAHINNAFSLLEQIGYKHYFSTPVHNNSPAAQAKKLRTSRTTAATTTALQTERPAIAAGPYIYDTLNFPQPVDLKIIERFLSD